MSKQKHRGHGEGSIFKRQDGRWCAELFVGFDQETGKKQTLRWYADTRKKVADDLTVTLRDRLQGLMSKPGKQTVGQFLDAWMRDAVKGAVRPTTYETYRYVLKHAGPIRDIALTRLTPQDLQRLYARALSSGLGRTVQVLHAVLHKALGQAVKWGLVPRNVTEAVESPKVDKKEFRALSPEEVSRLLAAASEDRLRALYVLAVTCGLRFGELLGLRWEDIDLGAGRLTVNHQLQRGQDGEPTLTAPKTARSRRTMKLSRAATDALRKHRVCQLKDRVQYADIWQDQGLVFATEIGTPLSESNVRNRSFHPILEKAGLPRIRFHDLRHTCATLLLAQGVHPKLVQEQLGHSKIGTTLDTYSHIVPSMMDQVAVAMDSIFGDKQTKTAGERT
jgi:integrase